MNTDFTWINRAHERLASVDQVPIEAKDVELALGQPLVPGLVAEELWALVAFVRHERRQMWVAHLVESRLSGNGSEFASRGYFGHPSHVPSTGDVPHEPGWSYEFHGRGCCFTHQDGTCIDVDFADDGSPVEIDPFFYSVFLQTLSRPDLCERKLIRAEAFRDAWHFDLQQLQELDLITDGHRFRLTERGHELGEAIEPLADRLSVSSAVESCWLLCLLCDYAAAEEEAVAVAVEPWRIVESQIRRKKDAAADSRAARIRAYLRQPRIRYAKDALISLAVLGRSLAASDVALALKQKPFTSVNHAALAILKDWDPEDLNEQILGFLRSLMQDSFLANAQTAIGIDNLTFCDADRPGMSLVVQLIRTLFERHDPSTLPQSARGLLLASLKARYFACDDEAAFFLYLLDESAGLARLAENLSSPVPMARTGAAGFLALIASDASIDILITMSQGNPENGGHEAACALSLLPGERPQAAARRWQRQPDGYENPRATALSDVADETNQIRTMEDHMRVSTRNFVNHWMKYDAKAFHKILATWSNRSGD